MDQFNISDSSLLITDNDDAPTIKVEEFIDEDNQMEVYSTSIEEMSEKDACEIYCGPLSLNSPTLKESVSDGDITIVPHVMLTETAEDKMHIISENSDMLSENPDSFQLQDEDHKVENSFQSTHYDEGICIEDVEEDGSPFSIDVKSEEPTSDNDQIHIKVDESTRRGFHDFTDHFDGDEAFMIKDRYIKVDKADPRSRLHFIKYMKKDGKTMKIWECGICGKEFVHQYNLMRHLPMHTDERNYKCEVCGKAFRQMSTLSQHRTTHSENKPYVCDICRKTFNRASTLISHKKIHTEKKPHQCNICGKAFHQKGNLKNHMFTHTKERPYKCDICGKGFNQSSNLHCHKSKVHIPYSTSSHQNSNEKYKCTQCSMAYSRRAQLRQHEEYQHGIKDVFSTKNSLKLNIAPGRNSFLHKKKIGNVRIIQLPNGDKAFQENRGGLLIDPIDTKAMHKALSLGNTPFALLKPAKGLPVVVKVQFAAGSKHMLVPASASELKAAGKFLITKQKEGSKSVQIKIPVVATICQRIDENGEVNLEVLPPSNELTENVEETATQVITENNQALLPSFIKSSINKSKNTITQHFILSPSIVKNSSAKESSLMVHQEASLQTLTTLMGDYTLSVATNHNAVTNDIRHNGVDILTSTVDLTSHDQVTLKDDILDIEGSAQYLRPTGVIGEYEVIDSSEASNIIGHESIINPIKNLFEDSGPVSVDPSHLSALIDVLQTAGYQLQTQSDGEELSESNLTGEDENNQRIILKTTGGTIVVNDQLVISNDATLEDVPSIHSGCHDGISLIVHEAIIQQ